MSNTMQENLSEKVIVAQVVMKSPSFYGTWTFTDMFTTANYCRLSWDTDVADDNVWGFKK
jgi:hypothetical protein